MKPSRATRAGVAVDSLGFEESSLKHNGEISPGREMIHSKKSVNERIKVAYIVSRFPKITETFILYEMLAVEQQNIAVELYPLLRALDTSIHPEGASLWRKIFERVSKPTKKMVMHPEAAKFVERAHYEPLLSKAILKSHFYYLQRMPRVYLNTLWTILRANWGSLNYFMGVLGIFPKVVYFAYLMNKDSIHHIHAHFANHPAAAAFIIHRLTGIPYSFTAHGADLQVDQHMLCEKIFHAAFVVTISDYNKNLIIEKCGEQVRNKIRIVHCGVDTRIFLPPKNDGHLGGSDDPFSILCIGTMYEVKGHTYLIEACRILKEKGMNFVCHLVGDGPDRAILEEQVFKAGLSDQVKFHGQCTRPQVLEYLRNATVVSVPSVPTSSGRREGIPVVLMEAMASGVPVVASGISGIPELVEDGKNGLLVPPRDPMAIADSIQHLINDPVLRLRLGKAGRRKVNHDFNLHKNAASLSEYFHAIGDHD